MVFEFLVAPHFSKFLADDVEVAYFHVRMRVVVFAALSDVDFQLQLPRSSLLAVG
jgi:hypothetical protein